MCTGVFVVVLIITVVVVEVAVAEAGAVFFVFVVVENFAIIVIAVVVVVSVVVVVAKPVVVAIFLVVLDGVVSVVNDGEEDDTNAIVVGDAFVGTDVVVYDSVSCAFVDVAVGGDVNISAVVAALLVVCCEIANSVDVVEDFVVIKEGY